MAKSMMMSLPVVSRLILRKVLMAIIRFLDKSKKCYQVHAPENPVMIYLTPYERKTILASKEGECLILLDSSLSEEEIQSQVEALNTKDDPQRLA